MSTETPTTTSEGDSVGYEGRRRRAPKSRPEDEGFDASAPLLEVRDLQVEFRTRDGVSRAVNGASFSVAEGETLGILGESGCGKSVTAQAIMGILDRPPAHIAGGRVILRGVDLLSLPEETRRKVRADRIAMVFQDALSALNPVFSVGWQLSELHRRHRGYGKQEAKKESIRLLDLVGIPGAADRVNDYPHQFSGGMRQRVMIAMSLALDPDVLIADEPTTALDVTVQAQILDLLQELQRDFGSAIVIITHDLGVIAEMADEVLVMYAGRCVEYGATREVLTHPEMPYTWGLLNSVPELTGDPEEALLPIPGSPPSLLNPPNGCAFHPRCGYSHLVPADLCTRELPLLEPSPRGESHLKRCHLLDPENDMRTHEPAVDDDVLEQPDLLVADRVQAPDQQTLSTAGDSNG